MLDRVELADVLYGELTVQLLRQAGLPVSLEVKLSIGASGVLAGDSRVWQGMPVLCGGVCRVHYSGWGGTPLGVLHWGSPSPSWA